MCWPKRDERGRRPAHPRLTVVIPSIGREKRLHETLRQLSRQAYQAWECIVVLQGDEGAEPVAPQTSTNSSRTRMFYLSEPNASLARNVGLVEAKGDIVLFLDDDVETPNLNFLRNHVRHFDDPSVPGVVGQVLAPGSTPRSSRHWLSRRKRTGWLFFPRNYDRPDRVLNGGSNNLSVRRNLAIAVGGMDAQYEKGAYREESDFCLRLTGSFGPLLYDPEASLVHIGEPSGGCRSWGSSKGVVPLHHACGEWYFLLNGLKLRTILARDVPLHLFTLFRYQILNRHNRDLRRISTALKRSLEGFRLARKKIGQGHRWIDRVEAGTYRET